MRINETTPLLSAIIFGAFAAGVIFSSMGIWLVYLGATGASDLRFFGQTISTSNVGISAIMIGATTTVLVIKRIIKTVELIINHQRSCRSEDSSGIAETAWPLLKTEETLRNKLIELSETQRKLIMLLSPSFFEGTHWKSRYELKNATNIPDGELHYRLLDLLHQKLIKRETRTRGDIYYKLDNQVQSLIAKHAIVQDALKGDDKSDGLRAIASWEAY